MKTQEMKTQHTPGPWKWVGKTDHPNSRGYLKSNDGTIIADAVDTIEVRPEDAALIASAPELLDVAMLAREAFKAEYEKNLEAGRTEAAECWLDLKDIAGSAILKAINPAALASATPQGEGKGNGN